MIQAIIALSRPLVIWLVQVGVTGLIYTLVDQLLNKLQDVIRDYYQIDDNSAGAVFVNIILDAAAFAGIGAAVVAKKIPLNVAKRMGLDASAPSRKAVSSAAAAKIGAKDVAAAGKGAKDYLDTALKVLGLPAAFIWLVSAVANIVEPGIYKPEQTNAVYKSLGIPYQYPTGSGAGTPGGFDSGEFTDYFRALETAGAKTISNPCKAQNVLFTRDELSALVDCIYGAEAAAGRPTTAAKLKPKLAQYIRLANGTTVPDSIGASSSTSSASGSVSGGTSYTGAKVYTGIVSQGVVGQGLSFTPRPDDLIESQAELQAAAQNNLSAYLAALPGRVVYEVKVVSSVISKDGFKQVGQTQRVQSGTNTDGSPRYKTVTNKFAVLVVYALTDKGTRTKLTQITLGPTNSAKLAVTQNYLSELATSLPGLVVEKDEAAISNITTSGTQGSKPKAQLGAGTYEYQGKYYRKSEDGTITAVSQSKAKAPITSVSNPDLFTGGEPLPTLSSSGSSVPAPSAAPVVSGTPTASQKPGASATTLYEWYTAQGQALPSLSARASTYQSLGLGQASFYTGTAEQNTKLLNALKG